MAKVLVVDDNKADRYLAQRYLADEHQLVECETLEATRALLARETVDCVLLDYRLPDGEGVDLIPEFTKRHIPVVVLTGQGDERVVVRSLKAGARDYLVKSGLTAEELRRAIRGALREGQLLAERNQLLEEQKALTATHEEFKLLLQSTPDFVSILSPTGSIKYINPAGCELIGWDPENVVGRGVSELSIEEESGRIVQALLPKAFEEGVWSGQTVLCSEAGERIPTDTVIIAKKDPAGKPLFAGLISRDLRSRAKLEAQLRQAQKMEAIGRLAGGVAHDFNNILTAIFSFSGFASESLEAAHPAQDDIEEIQRAAKRAAELTQQLLSFSRKRAVEPEVVDPNKLLRSSTKMLARLIGEDVSIELRANATGTIQIDPGAFEQVLVNLAVNARDAMPRGGKLTLETEDAVLDEEYGAERGVAIPTGDYLVISVSDTGVGMDKETQLHIFEPFFTTKPPDKGTGLGLATAFGIIKQADGFIWVYSEEGVGTTVRIYLPRVSAEALPASPTPAPDATRGNERVLVVEDDAQIRRLARRALERAGYQVVVAEDGAQAKSVAEPKAHEFDLLLTDVVMPGMNGKEVAECLSRKNPRLKVLFMSGYTADAIAHHGVLEKGVQLLQKPFSAQQLTSRVREVLDNGDSGNG